MAGNVMEWALDGYWPYPSEPQTNPVGARSVLRIVRGNAFGQDEIDLCRARQRDPTAPSFRRGYFGFRCAHGVQ